MISTLHFEFSTYIIDKQINFFSDVLQNKVEDIFEKDKEPTNTALWKCFSVAIDRLGILLFVFTVTVGCGCVFGQITS